MTYRVYTSFVSFLFIVQKMSSPRMQLVAYGEDDIFHARWSKNHATFKGLDGHLVIESSNVLAILEAIARDSGSLQGFSLLI